MQTKGISAIESKMEDIPPSSFRWQVLDAARRFKTNWIDLAKYLYSVKRDRLFKEWGYISFDTYCTKEIGIKKQTAFKLLSSYYFLTREEPQLLEEETLQKKEPGSLPNYEAINILRRAKANKDLREEDYNNLKEAVFERATEPREVGKQFRSMLRAIKNINPEKERKQKRIHTIKRLLSTLKALRREVVLLNILPDRPIKDIDKAISSLERELQ